MLFPEEDGPLLKAWIVKRIENTFVTAHVDDDCWTALDGCANTHRTDPTPIPTSLLTMLLPYSSMMVIATRCGSCANRRFLIF